MKINGIEVVGKEFAYDGCHKIYVIEDEEDRNKAISYGYDIYMIEDLQMIYENSCPLRFVHNWKLTQTYVAQDESAIFEG